MISPIGSWIVKIDAAILSGMDAALQGLVPHMRAPVASAILLFLAVKGLRVAQGDAGALNSLWMSAVKIIIVVALATNIGHFDTYVRDLFYKGLPDALNNAVAGASVTSGVGGTAATFDGLWAQMWVSVSNVWAAAGTFDVGSRLAAAFCALTVGLGLMAMALIYLLARLLLAVVIVLGPLAIACTLHEQTKPIFERWMGKVIALTCLQVCGIIVLQILLTADKEFMAQIAATAPASGGGGWGGGTAPSLASELQSLISMVIWFGMGAFAMYALPAIAYSIGTGVAISTLPVLASMFAAGRASVSAVSGLIGSAGGGGAAAEFSGGNFGLQLARSEVAGESGGTLALPPPPPPALSSSTRLLPGN